MPRQVVEGTVRLPVRCQHLGIDYNLRQLGAARFCLRSPVDGQLTPPAPSRTDHYQRKRQNNPHDPGLLAKRPRPEVRTDAQDAAYGWNHGESSAGISAHTSNDTDSIYGPPTEIQTSLWSPKYKRGVDFSDDFVPSSRHNSCEYRISPYAQSCPAKKKHPNFFLYFWN